MAVENLDSGDDGINETSVTVGFSLPPVIGTNGPVDRYCLSYIAHFYSHS